MLNTVPALQVCKRWPPEEGGECRGRGSSSRVYPRRRRCSLGLVSEGAVRKDRDGGGGIPGRGRSPGKSVMAATGSEAQTCDEMFSVGREGNWLEGDRLLLEAMGGRSVRSLQVQLSGRQRAEPVGDPCKGSGVELWPRRSYF